MADKTDDKALLYVGVEDVQRDFGVSKAKAYDLIRQMNDDMARTFPHSVTVSGKVNRIWYDNCLLLTQQKQKEIKNIPHSYPW